MILTNRLFERVAPSREAKNIYIFCEGAKREYNYFLFFRERDSRINIEIYKLDSKEDNSPLGLLKIAEKCIVKTDKNPNPKYNFIEGDEVWIVLDIDKDKNDSREAQIEFVKKECKRKNNWFLTRSNPCFEVWLYYHLFSERPMLNEAEKCPAWKKYVNESVIGGFDPRKHPIFIETASRNAANNFSLVKNKPDIGCTEIYNLANSIVPLLKDKLEKVLKQIVKQ